MLHFTALILRIDIQTKGLYSHELTKIPGCENISEHSDRLLAQHFEAVLAVAVILGGDTIFAKNPKM